MKKFLVIVALLLIIVFSFGFAWLKIQARGPETNDFNQRWRARFARSAWLRNSLGLHWDGDARTDYLGSGYKKILVEADIMDTEGVYLGALDTLTQKIQEATGKPTTYLISDRHIPYQREVSDGDIKKITKQNRTHKNTSDTATLYLLYLSRDAETASLLGKTFEEYGLVLFGDSLADFTQNSSDTEARYQESTALHEFGHQLGLPHDAEPGCLMQEKAETNDQVQVRPEEVITDFCDLEKSLIKQ